MACLALTVSVTIVFYALHYCKGQKWSYLNLNFHSIRHHRGTVVAPLTTVFVFFATLKGLKRFYAFLCTNFKAKIMIFE